MTTVSTIISSTGTAGPFGSGPSISLWDPVSQRDIKLTAAELFELKNKAAFMEFLIYADPHIKEMWTAFNTKERILK